jgi:hypothetical protein
MLDNKILRNIQDIIDELYPAVIMLNQYKHEEDVPLGFLMCVTTRAKIYENTKTLIKMYKKGQDYYDYFTITYYKEYFINSQTIFIYSHARRFTAARL